MLVKNEFLVGKGLWVGAKIWHALVTLSIGTIRELLPLRTARASDELCAHMAKTTWYRHEHSTGVKRAKVRNEADSCAVQAEVSTWLAQTCAQFVKKRVLGLDLISPGACAWVGVHEKISLTSDIIISDNCLPPLKGPPGRDNVTGRAFHEK